MSQWLVSVFLLLSTIIPSTNAYNRPYCGDWPSFREWNAFEDSLIDSPLYGPFYNSPSFAYSKHCLLPDQHHVSLLKQGKGLCMSTHRCAQEFCQDLGAMELPAYSVEVHSVEDIQTSLAFATQHNIRVAIKSSGHSYESQSMGRDALLLWMRYFPQTNAITQNYVDSAGTAHGTTIAVAGGQNFDDLMFAVKDQYHMVTGFCRTVAMGGGWILGGGLSFTSRFYGYGVDQVVALTMVLADGSVVEADANQNTDLFWASLGGGGGTMGVLTRLEYKLHPPTPITYLNYGYGGPSSGRGRFIRDFVTFMVGQIRQTPELDYRWGGAMGRGVTKLCFVGTRAEAASSAFMVAMDAWYDALGYDPGFEKPSTLLVEHASWYQFRGGDEGYENPDFDTSASSESAISRDTLSRIIPRQVFLDDPDGIIDLLTDLFVTEDIGTDTCYLLSGKTSEVGAADTAVHPTMREAGLMVEMRYADAAQRVRDYLQGYTSSVCYNHHSATEPNWREASWGANQPRLLAIKEDVDPGHLFNVYHGIGYRGLEYGDSFWDRLFQDGCPWRNQLSVFIIFSRLLSRLRYLILSIF